MMYGNGSGLVFPCGGFGIPSLDPKACVEPVMKCPCEKCRVMRDELFKFYNVVRNSKEQANESEK